MNLRNKTAVAQIRANWMEREEIVAVLATAGIDCQDNESTDDLRIALVSNVIDGDIDLDQLPESGTDAEKRYLQ